MGGSDAEDEVGEGQDAAMNGVAIAKAPATTNARSYRLLAIREPPTTGPSAWPAP